jgi:predicted  nucleic acid-binding Zn-ribbon protein
MSGFARQLERELNTANKRIKQLEAKVDELHDLEKWLEGR